MTRDELASQFSESSRAMHKAWRTAFLKTSKATGSEELSPAQVGILFVISRKSQINGQKIATEMMISRSAVTQLIDALCQTGYATKLTDDDDRRNMRIELTDKGRQKLKQAEKVRNIIFAAVTANFTDEELQAAINFNKKMLAELDKYNEQERDEAI